MWHRLFGFGGCHRWYIFPVFGLRSLFPFFSFLLTHRRSEQKYTEGSTHGKRKWTLQNAQYVVNRSSHNVKHHSRARLRKKTSFLEKPRCMHPIEETGFDTSRQAAPYNCIPARIITVFEIHRFFTNVFRRSLQFCSSVVLYMRQKTPNSITLSAIFT